MSRMKIHKIMPDRNPQGRSAQIGDVIIYGTFGLLLFGPIGFGAVEPWAILILETGSLALLLLWLVQQWVAGEITILWNPLYAPMAAFGALILLQVIFRMSAYPHDTVANALLYVAYGMLCFLATQTLTRSSQARKIAVTLALYGFALAALALLQGIAPNGKLYWIRQPRMGGWIYGSYVNHNHYAGIMELLVPIPLVISLSHLAQEKKRIAAGAAAAIMVGTIFLSGSRGGMLAIFVELAALAAVLFRKKRNFQFVISGVTFVVILISLLAWLGGKELGARVRSISSEAKSEISGGTRLYIDRDTLKMFSHKPLLGWGLGTFPVVYPQFRSFYTNFFVNEAHNDYLQLLSEMGTVGFGVMIWFVIVLYRRALSKLGNWTTEVTGAVSLACLLGATGILVHSFFDFNLQIPANAAFFYVYCALASSSPLLHRTRKRKPATREQEEVLPASEVV